VVRSVSAAPHIRYRALLLSAAHDTAEGAHALSEIDFGRLRRRNQLPLPIRQAVRRESGGRRR
jgi:hypothetical protein